MSTTKTLTPADELFSRPDDGFRYELVKGELRRMPLAGSERGSIAMQLGAALYQFVDANGLGAIFSADTGFRIGSDPDTVRAPDVAFVRRERIPASGIPKEFWPGAPDLAVEVISPSDTHTQVEETVVDWLAAGTRTVVLVNPRTRTLTVYYSPTEVTRLTESDVLTGGEILPGFACRVSELFT